MTFMSRNSTSDEIKSRALGAVLSSAFLRWESLVTVLLTVMLFLFVPQPFTWWQDWFWLVGGAIAEIALVATALTDQETAQRAVAREFENRFDMRAVRNRVSRERLQNALEYRQGMRDLVERHKGAMKVSLRQTVDEVDDWISQMYELALHIDAFEENELVERDRRMVPQKLDQTRTALEREKNPAIRNDLEQQLRVLEQQLANLQATANSAKRAEIQLESTLSSLGTIYAQMSLMGTKEVDSARAQRLRLEIQDEVAGLQETIEAMDEVQAQRLRLG
jgi:hypothetical protein